MAGPDLLNRLNVADVARPTVSRESRRRLNAVTIRSQGFPTEVSPRCGSVLCAFGKGPLALRSRLVKGRVRLEEKTARFAGAAQ